MYKDFYDKVSELYKRAQHGAISGDDFCYEVGQLLKENAEHQMHLTDGGLPASDNESKPAAIGR